MNNDIFLSILVILLMLASLVGLVGLLTVEVLCAIQRYKMNKLEIEEKKANYEKRYGS